MRKRSVFAWVVALICFLVLMIVTPAIPQSQEYHNFADQRTFFGNPFYSYYLYYALLFCTLITRIQFNWCVCVSELAGEFHFFFF